TGYSKIPVFCLFDLKNLEDKIKHMEREELWKSVLSELEIQISRPNFLTWLKNSRLLDVKNDVAVISLPNYFTKEWVENKYNKLIISTLKNINYSIKKAEYIVESIPKPSVLSKDPEPKALEKQLLLQETKIDPETNLNPKYTLDSFIVGSFNELAYSAAMAVVKNIGTKYNPLFIYGGVGLGKTHLIQGIGNEIKSVYKNKVKIKYVTSEKFTNEVIWAIRNRRMDDIKSAYRSVDVLLIDDIQFIGGKEKTEEEFFYTFNSLYENNKQIIISSDRPPKALPVLEERLRSRFEGGMIADITYPEYEARVAIIKTKTQEKELELEQKIIELIAKRAQRNIREIEGILNKILFYQSTKGRILALEELEKIVSEMTDKGIINISPAQIIKSVSDFFEILPNDLTGRSRSKELIEPRQIAIYLLRDMLDMSFPYIASKIGKRDHSTAIYAYKKINDNLTRNTNLHQKIMMIKELVNKSE
ncbi:MAG: chromosomal replication initiator protein DnaA, partial [Patescibacteria group bacterium]|nr:chromosomal replication initiator protein DnaA [Patescibacteria group bacterium]